MFLVAGMGPHYTKNIVPTGNPRVREGAATLKTQDGYERKSAVAERSEKSTKDAITESGL